MRFLLIFLIMVISEVLAVASDNSGEALVKIDDKATLIGFFPPVTQSQIDDRMSGSSEGIAHVRFALEDTLQCLKASGLKIEAHLVLATTIVIETGAETTRIKLPEAWPESVGVYLLKPGASPRAVYAEAGPSSLIVLVPDAAADYFGVPSCRR